MEKKTAPRPPKHRLLQHRRRLVASGARRVEVTVPAEDVQAIRDLAAALRAGGKHAQTARRALRPVARSGKLRTGADLVEFFRKSPLYGLDLEFERDKSPGRPIDT